MSSDGAGNTTDKITETIKVTEGYFTNGDGTMEGPLIYTASINNSNEAYYYDVCNAHPGSASSDILKVLVLISMVILEVLLV
jgi:hypothetical protein